MAKNVGRMSDGPQSFAPIWSARRQAVCFVHGDTGTACAILRGALEVLEGRAPLGGADCLNAFRRHHRWIHELAGVQIAERGGDGDMVVTPADVRFQLACENTDLPAVLCV
jgi:hypothetical protein